MLPEKDRNNPLGVSTTSDMPTNPKERPDKKSDHVLVAWEYRIRVFEPVTTLRRLFADSPRAKVYVFSWVFTSDATEWVEVMVRK